MTSEPVALIIYFASAHVVADYQPATEPEHFDVMLPPGSYVAGDLRLATLMAKHHWLARAFRTLTVLEAGQLPA